MDWDQKFNSYLKSTDHSNKILNDLDEYYTDIWNKKIFTLDDIDTDIKLSSQYLKNDDIFFFDLKSNSQSTKKELDQDRINSLFEIWDSFDNNSTEEIDETELNYNTEQQQKISYENEINKEREIILSRDYTSQLINLIREEDFEFGYISRSESLIREQLQLNKLATKNWLNEVFVKNFKNEVILIGMLRIISRFEIDEIFPQGQTMAIAALSHKNDEIKELGIRAFEKWGSEESLEILKSLDLSSRWLKEYVEQIIEDLEA